MNDSAFAIGVGFGAEESTEVDDDDLEMEGRSAMSMPRSPGFSSTRVFWQTDDRGHNKVPNMQSTRRKHYRREMTMQPRTLSFSLPLFKVRRIVLTQE